MKSRVFRVNWRTWTSGVILPLAAIALVIALSIGRPSPVRAKIAFEAVMLAVAVFIWFRSGRRFWRTRLKVSQDGITCQGAKVSIEICWTEVLAAWRTTEARQDFFNIGTAGQVVPIPLRLFTADLAPILEALVPPESLEAASYNRLPQYKAWCAKQKAIVQATATVLRANLTQIKVLGWVYLILFPPVTVLTVLFVRGPAVWFAIIPGILAIVGPYFLLSSGQIEVNSACATRIKPRHRYAMRWDEVEVVETDREGQAIVLLGGDKCLALPGSAWWSGKQKADVIEFFLAEIEERGITVHETGKALLRRSKNTKVVKAQR